MHGREHVVAVRPGKSGLIAHTLFYVDEVRGQNEHRTITTGINPKELELATTFTQALAGPFAPEEFTDKYRESVKNLISVKTNRNDVSTLTSASSEPSPQPAPVIDIMEALKKSLEMKKPPTLERNAAQPKRAVATRHQPHRRGTG
jgi:DNA end-binding protein Ku